MPSIPPTPTPRVAAAQVYLPGAYEALGRALVAWNTTYLDAALTAAEGFIQSARAAMEEEEVTIPPAALDADNATPIRSIKLTPGSDLHLIMLGTPMHFNLLRGRDYQDILAYGRSVWASALKYAETSAARAAGNKEGGDQHGPAVRSAAATPAEVVIPVGRDTDTNALEAKKAGAGERLIDRGVVVSWAVDRWIYEVKHRPLMNIHRRSLDGAWRQVIRKFGGDPEALIGPSHDDLLAKKRGGAE